MVQYCQQCSLHRTAPHPSSSQRRNACTSHSLTCLSYSPQWYRYTVHSINGVCYVMMISVVDRHFSYVTILSSSKYPTDLLIVVFILLMLSNPILIILLLPLKYRQFYELRWRPLPFCRCMLCVIKADKCTRDLRYVVQSIFHMLICLYSANEVHRDRYDSLLPFLSLVSYRSPDILLLEQLTQIYSAK